MKKALIITWDGFQDQEVIYPYYRLQEENFIVEIVGTKHKNEVIGLLGTKFPSIDITKFNSKPEIPYDLLVLPGGVKALEKVRQEEIIINFIYNWPDTKVIASICHGAQLLISAHKVKLNKISGYYSIADDIRNANGVYSREPIVSNNIVSAAHYKDMPEWMKLTLVTYDKLSRSYSS